MININAVATSDADLIMRSQCLFWLFSQEELLISVLPRHIASNMMADIVGKIKHERFRKMYMTRHENVRYDQQSVCCCFPGHEWKHNLFHLKEPCSLGC